MIRSKKCPCGKIFKYRVGIGLDRVYCSDRCLKHFGKIRTEKQKESLLECSTLGCQNLANRKGAGLCEACYMRLRRNGSVFFKRSKKYRLRHSGGYYLVNEPNHYLADKSGYVYEHRFVFYNNHGNGPFECYHCGKEITWDRMHIDHLDDDKTNNKIDNLVPSCPVCNQYRGRPKMIKTKRANGKQIEYKGVSKTAGEWATELGLSRSAFASRVLKWGVELAIETPKINTGPRPRGKGE